MITNRCVIQKGIAGFGNRFQVLGYCLDIAIKHDAKLFIDWRDSSWGDDFLNYFDTRTPLIDNFQRGGKFDDVKPEWWADKLEAPCAKKLAGENFVRINDAIVSEGWKTLVVCQYKAQFSDRIFNVISPKVQILNLLRDFKSRVSNYDCWHIRATDKTAGDPFKILEKIGKHRPDHRKVLITDNRNVMEEANRNGILCESMIPEVPEKGGIHHLGQLWLKSCGPSREILNRGAILDILIGANANHFYETCPNSSYSYLINRIRNWKSTIIDNVMDGRWG
jgi:hypothetical protein